MVCRLSHRSPWTRFAVIAAFLGGSIGASRSIARAAEAPKPAAAAAPSNNHADNHADKPADKSADKSADASAAKPEQLFDGKTLAGWVVEGTKTAEKNGKKQDNWYVADDEIRCAGAGFGFLRYDPKQYGDFHLTLQYKISKGGNSGIGIRTVKYKDGKFETRPSAASYELQILDDGKKKPDAHSTMSLYRYVAPKVSAARPASEWNDVDIECVGPHIHVTLNGKLVQDIDQTTVEVIKSKPLSGYLCLQCHGSVVAFRKIEVTELKSGQQRHETAGKPTEKHEEAKPAAKS
jgi:hypothetical protein